MTAPVVIRQGCFVGAGPIVLPGCTIGPRAFVGAGSLVNRNVEEDATVARVPIRPIAAGREP